MGDDVRTYSRADLELVALMAANRAVTGEPIIRHGDGLVVDSAAYVVARRALDEFEEERGAALGYSAEQLSGTRSGSDLPELERLHSPGGTRRSANDGQGAH